MFAVRVGPRGAACGSARGLRPARPWLACVPSSRVSEQAQAGERDFPTRAAWPALQRRDTPEYGMTQPGRGGASLRHRAHVHLVDSGPYGAMRE